MKKDVSVYVPSHPSSGLGLNESSKLLQNVRKVFRRGTPVGPRHSGGGGGIGVAAAGTAAAAAMAAGGEASGALRRSSRGPTDEEIELSHGYAFSQEEDGAVSQVEFVRRYDTTKSPRGGT